MAQPIKKTIGRNPIKRKKETTRAGKIKQIRERMKGSQEFGTSKLEERFAREFLDKLGVKYVYQFKATGINRYFDFCVYSGDNIEAGHKCIIEIDGGYWHGDPRLYEEKDLNKTQKWSKKVDELKNKWCSRNAIPLIRIWEKDINENPEMVMNYLKDMLKPWMDGTIDAKKKRH